jgi:signal transduction histidine kinase
VLARADVGRIAPREQIDLADVVVEAASELEPMADGHDLSVQVEPAPVWGTRDELHRLAANLIENAIHHTPAGTQVRASTRFDGDGHALLVVEDNGPGVPDELAAQLFERFVRGTGDRGGSFGLGLAIVRAVAESHGGSVTYEHGDAGTGARFVVRLPALSGAEAPAPEAEAASRGATV